MRRLATHAVRRVPPRLVRRRSHPSVVRPGWPEDCDTTALSAAVSEVVGSSRFTIAHSALSGWKSVGAYRLHVSPTSQPPTTLVLKVALYSSRVTPAAEALGLRPGPPEFAVLGHGGAELQPYLPRVYQHEALASGSGYRYLMEDLGRTHRSMLGTPDFVSIARFLPRLHAAMDAEAGRLDPFLLDIDQAALLLRVEDALRRVAEESVPPLLPSLLDRWSEVAAAWSHPHRERRRIHGDLNQANVLVGHTEHPIKVLDWEWAMFAEPVDDLAALLKLADRALQRRAVRAYAAAAGRPDAEVQTSYLHARLRRLVLDTAFLGLQSLDATEPVSWLERSIVGSTRDALRTLRLIGSRRT